MRRPAWLTPWRLGVAASVLGAALLVVGARIAGRSAPADVATIEVARGDFLREVAAMGTLRAVRATPIVAPPQSGRQQKIAVLARDGTILREGDLVVAFDPYDAQREAADGQADLAAAAAKIEK
jgi:multidrug efflux pump subunit AcrA (membrane-fusion protein)